MLTNDPTNQRKIYDKIRIESRAWDINKKKMYKVTSMDFSCIVDYSLYINYHGAVIQNEKGNLDFRKYNELIIMLYSGRNDQNHAKIYENDVLYDGKRKGLVEYGEFNEHLGWFVHWEHVDRRESLIKVLKRGNIDVLGILLRKC